MKYYQFTAFEYVCVWTRNATIYKIAAAIGKKLLSNQPVEGIEVVSSSNSNSDMSAFAGNVFAI